MMKSRSAASLVLAVSALASVLSCSGARLQAPQAPRIDDAREPAGFLGWGKKPVAATAYVLDGTEQTILGWDGDKDEAKLRIDGSYSIRDGRNVEVSFACAKSASAFAWSQEKGYLPAFTSSFATSEGFRVDLRSFADQVTIDGNSYVIAYSRVQAKNESGKERAFDPGASRELTALTQDGGKPFAPGESRIYDFAIVEDRFGADVSLPSSKALSAAGGWDQHFKHMSDFWERKLSEIASLELPDPALANAYRAGFIYAQITKDDRVLKPGGFTYDYLYNHDAVGIAATFFTQGYLSEGPALLGALPDNLGYDDGVWKRPWPFAVYLLKTGDTEPVRRAFPSLRETMRSLHDARTGPNRTVRSSNALDTGGSWTVDDWSALTGLLAYRFVSEKLGESAEAKWADAEYASLLASVNGQLGETMRKYKLAYLPCAIVDPPKASRCLQADDANWGSHLMFGRWGWDGWLLGAGDEGPVGPIGESIDKTYDNGFARLREIGFAPHNFGGYQNISTGYNAGYGAAGLRGSRYRSEGIHAFQYMIEQRQSGPNSWWESAGDASKRPLWNDGHPHPTQGVGDAPHIWGEAVGSKVLLESLVAEFFDGRLLLGRGLPNEWVKPGKTVRVKRMPLSGRRRIDVAFSFPDKDTIDVSLSGATLEREAWIDLPIFLSRQVASASAGRIDAPNARVVLEPGVTSTRIKLGSKRAQ